MKRFLNFKTIVIVLCILIVILLVAYLGGHHGKNGQPTGHTQAPPPATAIIEITPSGFVPKTLAVAPNTNVVWVNEDKMPHLPAADPYPSHTSLPYLVAPRALGVKETYTFLVSKQETINYHDDLHPLLTGTIEVK